MEALLVTAFVAGLVATVNPCGFAMLPAYLSFFLGSTDDIAPGRQLGRALRIASMMALSFLVVFGLAGLLLTAGLQVVIDALPWMALVVGVGIVGLGVYVFKGGVIALSLPGKGRVNRRSVFGFGVSYAVASLSCTLPIFLSLIAGSISTGSLVSGVSLFLVYGLGMALVIAAITVGLAFGRDRIVAFIRGASRWIGPASGLILIAAGAFIVWYWATVLIAGSVALGQVGLVRFVDQMSSTITDYVRRNAAWVTLGLVGVVAAIGWRLASMDDEESVPEERVKVKP
jgi:cytochrome c biogenesis protein CcdA